MATKSYNKAHSHRGGGNKGSRGSRAIAPQNPDYVRPKKALGQHFLTDMGVARSIAEAMSEGGRVLEVGCGTGVLTQFLLARTDIETWGAEVDGESVEYLHNHYPDFTPRLIYGDFLNLPLGEMFPGGLKVIGNFPYNISSQIFFKVLDYKDLIPEVVGMVQREVALRIASPAGNRDYGILSVLMQAWYDIEYLFTVHEDVFNPPPKVKSAVVRMRRNKVSDLGCNEALFVKVVKAAFSQRRKMLKTPLKAIFGDLGGEEHRFFSLRAEALTVADYIELTNWVEEKTGCN
ncbi:MAG: ribosomal RNA small subunit methyltransferase A [Tidjanibacter sp.]|nr:ribosomal RNA small subunit methyltransferase A [Tidjanibacter sp.]